MSKEEYLKYLMSKDIDSLSKEEQQFFYENVDYQTIEWFIDECMTAALIEGITEENYIKEKINVNKILKRFG